MFPIYRTINTLVAMFAFWLAPQRERGKDREIERRKHRLHRDTKREPEPGEMTEWERPRPLGNYVC